MSRIIRILLLVTSLVIFVSQQSEARPTGTTDSSVGITSSDESTEYSINELEDLLDQLVAVYDYIGDVIAKLMSSQQKDTDKTEEDKEAERQVESLNTLHVALKAVMAKVIDKVDILKKEAQKKTKSGSKGGPKKLFEDLQPQQDFFQLAK